MCNSASHDHSTMYGVTTALGGRVDFLLAPASTCGTLRGCGEDVRDPRMATRGIAVGALGSLILSDTRASRKIPGLGAGLRPPLCEPSLVDELVHVNDLDCVVDRRRLMERKAIFGGGSSGGALSAIETFLGRVLSAAVAMALLPGRGERSLETLCADDWELSHFGLVRSLWREAGTRL